MNALEARRKSKMNAPIQKARMDSWARKEAEKKRLEKQKRHNDFYNKLKKDVDQHIEWAVKRGECWIEYQVKGAYPNWELKEFLDKHYEFTPELNKLVNYLKNKGFKARIDKNVTAHDDTIAYANSGGECGSSHITYSNDLMIKIFW